MRTITGTPPLWPVLLTCLLAASCERASDSAVGDPGSSETASAELAARIAALDRTVAAAEGVRSVKRLQWAYGHYSEFGLWHDFADLFADTGIGHYTQGDLDREGIRALFLDQVGQGQLGLATGRIYPHISFAPVITLAADGEHALGRFRILALLGGYGGNALWFHGVYENAYVRERSVWKINEVSNAAQVSGTFAAGLAASNAAAPALAFHYEPGELGRVLAAGDGNVAPAAGGNIAPSSAERDASPAPAPTDPRTLAASLADLERRLDRLDDEAALVRLQHQYGYLRDRHDWDALVALFAEQGRFEPGLQGVYVGKASIRRALEQFGDAPLPEGQIDHRTLFQTYVSVAPDGQSAAARVDELGLQGTPGVSAQWTQGIYENSFVRENGEWRIASLHYYPRLITDYDLGWGADAQPAPGPSAEFPADTAPSETVGVYPEFYIPPLHFAHPVTGSGPQYPEGNPAGTRPVGFAAATLPGPDAATEGATGRATGGATGVASPSPSVDALQSALSAAEARAQLAQAPDAVENLIAAYAYYLDECLPGDAAALFSTAAAMTAAACADDGDVTLHHVTQPVITIEGDGTTARFSARLWEVHAAEVDTYRGGVLEGEARLEEGFWKLFSVSPSYAWSATAPLPR